MNIDQLDEAQAKAALKAALEEKALADATVGNLKQDVAAQQQKVATLEERVNEQTEKTKQATDELKFIRLNPPVHAGTIEQLHQDPIVAKAQREKLEAETKYFEAQHGWKTRVSHAADKAFWPIVQEQSSFVVTEWRKKRWPTEMEQQNKKLGELKIKGEKRTLNMNDLDLATKLIAIDQNKRTQEVSEGFADAQMLGQILTNIQILSADQSSKDEKQGKRIDALVQEGLILQERQLAQFSARIKAQQTKSSENTLFANQLVGRVVAQRKKEEEKDKKQKEQRKLEKELERKKQEESAKKLKDFLNTRDDD